LQSAWRKYNPTVRTILPVTLILLTGCSTTTWRGNLSAAAERVTAGGESLWHGAGKLWPVGVWPTGIWVADYEQAEQLASESGHGTLFLFTQKDLTREDAVRVLLEDPAVRGFAADYIPAILFQRNESDRRYAAQFGVHRAPAVIVVHPDGTYHATQGSLTPEKLTAFLSESSPPGATPTINPHVTRQLGYSWIRDWESAKQASQESGRPIFLVLERWMSRDWDALRPMLERREVYSRTANMVHCRPSTAWSSVSGVASELGVENIPAIVIVPANGGQPSILELPTSYESVVRFADQASGRTVTDAQP
jgi:hypothetical protein